MIKKRYENIFTNPMNQKAPSKLFCCHTLAFTHRGQHTHTDKLLLPWQKQYRRHSKRIVQHIASKKQFQIWLCDGDIGTHAFLRAHTGNFKVRNSVGDEAKPAGNVIAPKIGRFQPLCIRSRAFFPTVYIAWPVRHQLGPSARCYDKPSAQITTGEKPAADSTVQHACEYGTTNVCCCQLVSSYACCLCLQRSHCISSLSSGEQWGSHSAAWWVELRVCMCHSQKAGRQINTQRFPSISGLISAAYCSSQTIKHLKKPQVRKLYRRLPFSTPLSKSVALY